MAENNALAKAETISQVGKLHMQGYSTTKIGAKLAIPVSTVRKYIAEWEEYISERAAKNPEMLDNFLENVMRFDEEIQMMNEEIWETVELAKENGAMGTKIQALRLSKDLMETKARLFQLLSPRMESGYIERMKRVERVNAILSSIIRETISGCERCRSVAFRKLEDAYNLMPELGEGDETHDDHIEDAIIVDE